MLLVARRGGAEDGCVRAEKTLTAGGLSCDVVLSVPAASVTVAIVSEEDNSFVFIL